MYDRNIAGKILDFDVSGSLYYSALVMQDDQTDSFWAIMSAEAIGGELQGKTLPELPISEKTTWGEWRARHPNTLVLSVEGVTHLDTDPYANYFTSDRIFGEVANPDPRLGLKEPIYVFRHGEDDYAVAHQAIIHGWQGKAEDMRVFVYRSSTESIYRSTRAWILNVDGKSFKLKKNKGKWISKEYGSFDPDTGRFEKGDVQLEPLMGMDTFWYIWSQYHPKGKLLGRR